MSIGNRIKEERTRLGLNQDEFAELGGVKRRAQSTYETGERAPDTDYLGKLQAAGVDVAYIVTGIRMPIAPAQPQESSASVKEPKAEYAAAGLSPRKAALFSLVEALDDAETDDIQAAVEKIEQAKALRRSAPDPQFRKAG